METFLQIQNISKSYFYSGKDNFILKNIEIKVSVGEITALIGANGTGKTTLFNIICGYEEANKNKNSKISFKNEYNLLKYKPHQLEKLGIGRLFQEAHIFPKLSILENMLVADENNFGDYPIHNLFKIRQSKIVEDERKEKALSILKQTFGESSIFVSNSNNLAENLSYGEQRLLGLVRLLMNDYQLLLLDEPTAGVNADIISKIIEILQLFKAKGKTVFFIEHNMNFIKKIADNVLFLNNHSIEIQGEPETVLNNEIVKKQYLGIIN